MLKIKKKMEQRLLIDTERLSVFAKVLVLHFTKGLI